MILVGVLLLAMIGLGVWLHKGHLEIIAPSEVIVRAGQDLRVPVSSLRPGKGKLFRIEGQEDDPVRVFVQRQDNGRMVVAFAACRRCQQTGRPSRVVDGQLTCGYCGEPTPILAEGAPLPKEKDCTPLPVQFRIDGDSVVVIAADIQAGRPLFARSQN
jgi:uncharacterized membrane protein